MSAAEVTVAGALAAMVVASWVIGGRVFYRLTRDLCALSQRVAYLEGGRSPRPPEDA